MMYDYVYVRGSSGIGIFNIFPKLLLASKTTGLHLYFTFNDKKIIIYPEMTEQDFYKKYDDGVKEFSGE